MTVSEPQRTLSLSHMGINCFDLPTMLAFYTGVLGMTVTDRGTLPAPLGAELVFLTTDPREHHQLVLVSGRKEGEISTAPAWDRDVLLEALSSYDRAAFRRGLLVGVAGATLGVVITIAAIAKMTGAPVAVEGPTLEWSTAEAKPPQP